MPSSDRSNDEQQAQLLLGNPIVLYDALIINRHLVDIIANWVKCAAWTDVYSLLTAF